MQLTYLPSQNNEEGMEISMKKKIEGFDGYLIDDLGNVYSLKRKKLILRTPRDSFGYYRIGLWDKGRCKHKFVHRLVAEAFILNPENKPQINHKDGNKKNNCVTNLEWSTSSENVKHAFRVLGKSPRRGEENPRSKIVLQIQDGKIIAEFYGVREAQRKTGIWATHIRAVCKKQHGLQHAGGYQWKYKDC